MPDWLNNFGRPLLSYRATATAAFGARCAASGSAGVSLPRTPNACIE